MSDQPEFCEFCEIDGYGNHAPRCPVQLEAELAHDRRELVKALEIIREQRSKLDKERNAKRELARLYDQLYTKNTGTGETITALEDELLQSTKDCESYALRLGSCQNDLDNAKGLLQGLVMALRSGATSEDILAEIKGGLGIVDDAPAVEGTGPIVTGVDLASGPDQTAYRCTKCGMFFSEPLAHECRVVERQEPSDADLKREVNRIARHMMGEDTDSEEPCPHTHIAAIGGYVVCISCGETLKDRPDEVRVLDRNGR